MHISCPMLAVVGRKASGKTTVAEILISGLIKEGFSVATVKHIAHEGFSIDREGSDTWRYRRAGANPIIAVSSNEVDIIIAGIRNVTLSLEKVSNIALLLGANVVILEGFTSIVLGEKSIGKIICLRSPEDYNEFKGRINGDLIALCSLQDLGGDILNIRNNYGILVERALSFIRKRMKILEILRSLARLDCGKCGRNTCEDLAEEIYNGTAGTKNCVVMEMRPMLKVKVTIQGEEIPLQPFVSEFIRKTVLGMISSLKNVKVHGDENVHINVLS